MKRYSLLTGIVIGSLSVLMLLLLMKLIGLPFHGAVNHHQAWGHGMVRHGFRTPVQASHNLELLAFFVPLVRIAVLAVGTALFVKASGLLKWAGALFAGLALMSLLTPFWGLLVILVAVWLRGRMRKKGTNLPMNVTVQPDRGRFLDEWEHNQKHNQ